MFRNRADLRFEGRIHEQILPSIRRADGDVVWTDVYVVHSGADQTPAGRARKLERDLRLLALDLADRPGHPFVLFNLGMTLANQKQFEEASSFLTQSVEASHSSESHLRKAYALLVESLEGDGRHREARRRCWEGLGRFPSDPELLFRCGVLAMHCREWEEAAKAFDLTLRTGPRRYFASIDPDLLGYKSMINLALAYEQLGRLDEAEIMWRKSLAIQPAHRGAWEGLAQNLLRSNRLEDLEQESAARLRDGSLRLPAMLARALLKERRGDRLGAGSDFEKILGEFPGDLATKREYTRLLFQEENFQQAETLLRDIVAAKPDDAAASHNLGQVLLRKKDLKGAIESFRASIAIRPDSASTLQHLGDALFAAGDTEGARECWRKAIG
jgi:tetratricopeptide (TPR) repeat protein